MKFKDHFSTRAEGYTRYRPGYPRELFAFLAEKAPARERVWDCATGNGQAAHALAEFFRDVRATDASERQIQHAKQRPGIRFSVAAAEESGLEPGSVDLTTVAQALHWFDFDRFYAEVRRVSKPGALLAAWCYKLQEISPEVDPIINHFYREIVGPFWATERDHIENDYQTIPFPFTSLPAPVFSMEANWDLENQLGYLRTWSAVANYRKQHGHDPVNLIGDSLAAAWGEPGSLKKVIWPLKLLLGVVA